MMVDKAFVDTNILLRAIIPQFSLHRSCETLIQKMWDDNVELWISRQVIREYLVQVTHPRTLTSPLTLEQIMAQMQTIQSLFRITNETTVVTEGLLELLQNYPTKGKQIHDANIVATMLAYDIDTLLTLNIKDFKRFKDKITLISIENPE